MDHVGPSGPGPYSRVVGRDDPPVRPASEAVFLWMWLSPILLGVKLEARFEAGRFWACSKGIYSVKAPRELLCWVKTALY